MIAVAGVGVALALKVALIKHELPGKIVLLGTPGNHIINISIYGTPTDTISPAEEGGNGKGILIDRGGYEDMDVCMMYVVHYTYTCYCIWLILLRRCHPGPGQDNYTSVATTLAMDAINLEYFGHT